MTAKKRKVSMSSVSSDSSSESLSTSESSSSLSSAELAERSRASCGPVTVAIPNTSEKKMEAIVSLAAALKSLAETLNSTNIKVEVKDCHIVGADIGINIERCL